MVYMQIYTALQTNNHASTPPLSFLQAGCPSCHPTNSVKAPKAHTHSEGKVCRVLKGPAKPENNSGLYKVLKLATGPEKHRVLVSLVLKN